MRERKKSDFGDLHLTFKVKPAIWNTNFDKKKAGVHTFSLAIGWNPTELVQIHHVYKGKKWLDFGDLDIIFKVTPAL